MAKINIGGQAVIEGVMMRAPRSIAIAVRRPTGEIVVKKDEVVPLSERYPVVKFPIVRGAVALFQSLIVGITALNFSANEAMVEAEGTEEKTELSSWAMAGTMAVAFGFGILLFFVLPLYATKLLTQLSFISDNNIIFNMVDGVIRVAVFLIYIWAISRMKDIQRVFQYHGAEHKSIFAFEAGDELTVANVRKYSCLHPRCGTSFLLIVMLHRRGFLRVVEMERQKRPLPPGADGHRSGARPATPYHPGAGRQPDRGGDPLHGGGVGG